MADELNLEAFLSDISARDDFLKNSAPGTGPDLLPPVRGAPVVEEITKPRSTKKAPKAAAAAAAPPSGPKDEADIWDAAEVPSLQDEARPATAPATSGGNGIPAAAKEVKPRQRKHAYEYFNQWDAYDVDGELGKLEDAKPAATEQAEAPPPPKNDGLPPDLTAAMLANMPAVEVERRALNEKNKGNEAYKASEYKTAAVHYTHSLRLQQNNCVVYANRGMCYLKLKQYRQALADSTAALQIDDAYTKAYLRRGIAHRRLGQNAQALKDLDIVLHREPHNKEAAEHRRCANLEREREIREERAFEANRAAASGRGKSSVMIEEVDGDSDDERIVEETPEMRRVREEEEAKDARERARAEAAERAGRERKGPMVDPQAMQESDELMNNLSQMSANSLFPGASKPAAKPGEKKKVTIVEDDDDEPPSKPAVARDGFTPSAKFAGAKPGWVFKSGADGLGYYREGPAPKPARMRTLAIEEVDDDDDEEEVPVKAKPAAKPTGGMRKMAIEEDSEEEEEPKAAPAKAPSGGMRKMAIVEDDDSEEEEPPAKAKPPSGGMRKMAIVEDDDSEEEVKAAPAPTGGMRKMAIVEDDDSEEEEPPAKAKAPAGGMRKMAIVEDDDSEEEEVKPPSGGMRKMAIEEDDEDDEEPRVVEIEPEVEAPLSGAAASALARADATRLKGNEAFKEGQYETATEQYGAALEQLAGRSHSSEIALAVKCLNNRAACSCQLQQYRGAIRDCTEVLDASPRDGKALMRRGFAYEAIERYAEALADMRAVQTIEPSPQASAACIRLSKFAAQRAALDGADSAKAAAKAPPPAKPSQAAAKPASTPSAPKAAEEEGPSKVMAEYKANEAKERGTAALKRGEYRTAAEAYHEACKLQPSVHTHFSNLSLALLKFGQPEHAVTAALRCTELAPTFGKGFFRLGQALKAKGEFDGACDALRQSLKLCQAANPNGGKDAGKEASEIARELAACREKAKAAPQTEPKGNAKGGISPIDATAAPTKVEAAAASSPPKRVVDQAAAAAMAKRAAEIASKAASPGGSAATLSAFERTFNVVWAKGKGGASPEALSELLSQLPTSAGEMTTFVRESLTEEILSGVILASRAAGEQAGVAAARIAHLSTCKRFDMAWMFVGKAEKEAVQALLVAGQGCAEVSAAELSQAAQRYGVKLA